MSKEIRLAKKAFSRLSSRYLSGSVKPIRIGFVGCGQHAKANLYPSLRHASVELVAICAKHRENAERVGRQFGAQRFYDNYQEMFSREKLDAVFVCVNSQLHSEIAIDALNHGLPVFVEKPPAPDSVEARKVFEVSEEKNLPVMVGFMKRFAPAYVEAKKIIKSSEFGQPNLINARLVVGSMKSEWEFLIDVAIHHLDLVRFFMGDVENLSVERFKKSGGVSIVTNLKFKNGAVGSLSFSSLQSWSNHNERVEIFGEESSIIVDNVVNLEYRRANSTKPGTVPANSEKNLFWQPNFSIPVAANNTIFLNGFVYEIRHFVDVVSGGRSLESSIKDGCRALEIAEEIYAR